jgi:hypothetical protein
MSILIAPHLVWVAGFSPPFVKYFRKRREVRLGRIGGEERPYLNGIPLAYLLSNNSTARKHTIIKMRRKVDVSHFSLSDYS